MAEAKHVRKKSQIPTGSTMVRSVSNPTVPTMVGWSPDSTGLIKNNAIQFQSTDSQNPQLQGNQRRVLARQFGQMQGNRNLLNAIGLSFVTGNLPIYQEGIFTSKQQSVQPNEVVKARVNIIMDLLEGITTASDSEVIVKQFSPEFAEAILTELKNRGLQYNESPEDMVLWLMSDLTESDRRKLRRMLAEFGVLGDLKKILAEEVIDLLEGYTSDEDSHQIFETLCQEELGGGGIDTVLSEMESKAGLHEIFMSEWLFGDMTSMDAERTRQYFLNNGGTKAQWYGILWSASRIASLLYGYTSHADSSAILWNFEQTPADKLKFVVNRLDEIVRDGWENIEIALMEEMDPVDYMALRSLYGMVTPEGKELSPYVDRRSWLEKQLSVAEWDLIVVEVIAGGLLGIVTGALSVLWDYIKIPWDIVKVAWHLIWTFFYFVTAGAVGSENYQAIYDFFYSLFETCGFVIEDPLSPIRQAWEEINFEAGTIQGVFAYGRRAELWVRRIIKLVLNIIIVARGAIVVSRKLGRGVKKFFSKPPASAPKIAEGKIPAGKPKVITPKARMSAERQATEIVKLRALKNTPGDHYYYPLDVHGRAVSAEGWLIRQKGPEPSKAIKNLVRANVGQKVDVCHLIPRQYNGSGNIGNLYPGNPRINRSYIKTLENAIRSHMDKGEKLYLKASAEYEGIGKIPTWVRHQLFKQEVDGSLSIVFDSYTDPLIAPSSPMGKVTGSEFYQPGTRGTKGGMQ